MGDRLVQKGVVDKADDVFFLRATEVPEALLNGGDRRSDVAARRATFEAAGKVIAPGSLGNPPEIPADAPPDPFMDALVFRLLGMVPPDDNPDPAGDQGRCGVAGCHHGQGASGAVTC